MSIAADAAAERAPMSGLIHVDDAGRARMVDVSAKEPTVRTAVAIGSISMSPEALRLALTGGGPKGAVEGVAEIAGVMAAKRTAELIPLCHSLALSAVHVAVGPTPDGAGLQVTTTVRTTGPTGVEMEALTGASVALLTLYDMLKAADKAMVIGGIQVIEKQGGRSGTESAEAR